MNSTIVGLVAAIAVLSGGLGFSMTGVFDDQNLMTTKIPGAGFLMGQVEIEARNADGEVFAYRLSDNEVVDDGEQCILKMLFATTTAGQNRGGYASAGAGACTGILTGAWNNIAIGTNNDSTPYRSADDGDSLAVQDTLVRLGNETSTVGGLERAKATTITWHNGTGVTATKIVLKNTFTSISANTHLIGESGLFNSTTWVAAGNGMLARQTFTDVSLATGDSITVTWTFTVGN
jgi:hypothetical protein